MALAQGLALLAAMALLAAAASDAAHFEIPDACALIILGTGVGFGALMPGFDWPGHLAAPAIMLGIGLLVFRLGLMGGGDIKLFVAIAVWTGIAGLPVQIIAVVISGGVLAILLLLARSLAIWMKGAADLPKLLRAGAPLPYAVAIAAGTFWWASRNWFIG